MCICRNLIHKFFDRGAVFLHILDIHVLGNLLALLLDILHQSGQFFLQIGFIYVADESKLELFVRRLLALGGFHLRQLL